MKYLVQCTPLLLLFFLNGCIGTDFIDDPVIGEKFTIMPRIDSLPVGTEQVFTIQFSNQYGVEEPAGMIDWSSSAPTKISISENGKATALAAGVATIYASNGNLTDSIVLNGMNSSGNPNNSDTSFLKQGIFMPVSNSYSAKGKVYVQTVGGVSRIRTASDFSTSAGPSVYLLLANHTNGSYSVTPGGHAVNAVSAQITANKLSTFSGVQVWDIPAGVNPADYDYVILYCVLGPVFGTATLQ